MSLTNGSFNKIVQDEVVSTYRRVLEGVTATTTLASLNQGGDVVSYGFSVTNSNGASINYIDVSNTTSTMQVGESFSTTVAEKNLLQIPFVSVELTDAVDRVVIVWSEK